MMIARLSLLNSLPRLASMAPFLCLIVAQCECPDMAPPHGRSTQYEVRSTEYGRVISKHAGRRLMGLALLLFASNFVLRSPYFFDHSSLLYETMPEVIRQRAELQFYGWANRSNLCLSSRYWSSSLRRLS